MRAWTPQADDMLTCAGKSMLGMAPALGLLATTTWVIAERADCYHLACITPAPSQGVAFFLASLGLLHSLYFVVQALQWSHYRPYPLADTDALPSLTVVIPAYNEGAMVGQSVASVLASDYPASRLHVVVIDDGSTDDTLEHIKTIAQAHPQRVQMVHFARNQGKRAALAAGFRRAEGAIIACLDSDSLVDADALRHLTAPFADPSVGAASGHVVVLNQGAMLGRMLQVQYSLAFDFARAAQSTYGAVSCCPGALSAFRRDVLLPHIDNWLNQRFLNRPVRHGEDQALTNIVLRQGLSTVYQRGAIVRTLAPTGYRQLCRMLTRWDRSTIVEGFCFAAFMFTAYRRRNRLFPAVHFCLSAARLVAAPVGTVMLLFALGREPAMLPVYAAGLLGAATFAALYYLWTKRSFYFVYGIVYALFSLFFLQWIFPWALITVRDERWGTR